jgi:hypothetical protein
VKFSPDSGFLRRFSRILPVLMPIKQYFDAANILVKTIKRGDLEDYKLENPALYLYRHSIELTIKREVCSWPSVALCGEIVLYLRDIQE